MYLQLPQAVARLGASFGNLKVIHICASCPGQFGSIGLNCNLLTTDNFPNLFGLTCKLWNCDVRLHRKYMLCLKPQASIDMLDGLLVTV